MKKEQNNRRYPISKVSDKVRVPLHLLRQWEKRFPQLKPKRDRANRRCYDEADIATILRIKELLWHEKMTTEGARRCLALELREQGRPRSKKEFLEGINAIENEVRAMLDILDSA